MMNEAELVNRIARAIPSFKRVNSPLGGLRVGIGDDAAVLAASGKRDWVVTTDAFLEGVHFLGDLDPADSVGYKALARAASDVAAMGAVPRFFFLTLAIPGRRTGSWLNGFLRGMSRAARELGLELAGGDTTRGESVAMSITVIGQVARGRAVLRSGAEPGDGIYLSGPLGAAQVGWLLGEAGHAGDRSLRPWRQRHLYPRIHLKLGHWLGQNRVASAMMDISDGLSTDLARLCAASRVGARLEEASIPTVQFTPAVALRLKKGGANAIEMALHGGDDYELLFTVPCASEKKLRRAPGFAAIARIGEVTRGRRIVIGRKNGREQDLKAAGWDPFRS